MEEPAGISHALSGACMCGVVVSRVLPPSPRGGEDPGNPAAGTRPGSQSMPGFRGSAGVSVAGGGAQGACSLTLGPCLHLIRL